MMNIDNNMHPRCECHDCTQYRAKKETLLQPMDNQIATWYCYGCQQNIPIGSTHVCAGWQNTGSAI